MQDPECLPLTHLTQVLIRLSSTSPRSVQGTGLTPACFVFLRTICLAFGTPTSEGREHNGSRNGFSQSSLGIIRAA